jgi:hypothetical protein
MIQDAVYLVNLISPVAVLKALQQLPLFGLFKPPNILVIICTLLQY